MIPFQAITLADRSWLRPLLWEVGTQNADFSFVNLYAWGNEYGLRAARVGGRFVTLMGEGARARYSFPVGTGALPPVLEAIRQDAAERGIAPVFTGVSPAEASALEVLCPGGLSVRQCPERNDYLYSAGKLASLAGKKLHAKRNHIHRFEDSFPDWHAEPVTEENLSQCRLVAELWRRDAEAARCESCDREARALETCLINFSALELEGCLITVSGVPAAFTVGSFLREDTVDVHFEKALGTYPGAYAMINRAFARQLTEKYPQVQWLNREEDMGLENLRKAKESYYPDAMAEKLEVTVCCAEGRKAG